jgi:hypothetical protein
MTFAQYVTGIVDIINLVVVPVIFALAFVAFLWGVLNAYFLSGDDESKRAQGHQFILWGIIGMVVLVSVWGLVNILLSTLGLN